MPATLPDPRQILAGIWLRLLILGPIITPVITILWLAGINVTNGTRTVGLLIVLVVLALDSARSPAEFMQART